MCQTDHVCTAWTPTGRCSRPATWTGSLFRCELHIRKLSKRAMSGGTGPKRHPHLAPKTKANPEPGDPDAT